MNTLRKAWASWKRIARRIGEAQARVILSLFYFVILPPFALLYRVIRRGSAARTAWEPAKGDDSSAAARAARQW